jgi:hypothetical protein
MVPMTANAAPGDRRYRGDMPIGRVSPRRIEPVRHLDELDNWLGHWVAIKDGRVIAASETSLDLAYRLKKLGNRAEGAVTEYVRPGRDDAYFVGVG